MMWNQFVYLVSLESFIRRDTNFNQFRNQFEQLILKNLIEVFHVQVLTGTYIEFMKLILEISEII